VPIPSSYADDDDDDWDDDDWDDDDWDDDDWDDDDWDDDDAKEYLDKIKDKLRRWSDENNDNDEEEALPVEKVEESQSEEVPEKQEKPAENSESQESEYSQPCEEEDKKKHKKRKKKKKVCIESWDEDDEDDDEDDDKCPVKDEEKDECPDEKEEPKKPCIKEKEEDDDDEHEYKCSEGWKTKIKDHCEFGAVIIIKKKVEWPVSPYINEIIFRFKPSWRSEFELEDGESKIFFVKPGSYCISEITAGGWKTSYKINCETIKKGNKVEVSLESFDVVKITFINEPPDFVIPETPYGTLFILAAMVVAYLANTKRLSIPFP
jgi:hypothetical protein